jgi:hypothetical protein
MRSLSSALEYRHHQEGAPSHHPGGRGCRDGHAWRHVGGRERGHTAFDQAGSYKYDPAGAGRGRGGRRVGPGGPDGLRHRADRGSRKVPAALRYCGSRERDRRPATGGIPRARQVIRARHTAGAPPGPAPRWRAGRSQWSRRPSAFRPAVRAKPHERVLAGRPARRAQGWSRARHARRAGHPGNLADRRTAVALRSTRSPGPRSAGRRAEPGPAVARPSRSSRG